VAQTVYLRGFFTHYFIAGRSLNPSAVLLLLKDLTGRWRKLDSLRYIRRSVLEERTKL